MSQSTFSDQIRPRPLISWLNCAAYTCSPHMHGLYISNNIFHSRTVPYLLSFNLELPRIVLIRIAWKIFTFAVHQSDIFLNPFLIEFLFFLCYCTFNKTFLTLNFVRFPKTEVTWISPLNLLCNSVCNSSSFAGHFFINPVKITYSVYF